MLRYTVRPISDRTRFGGSRQESAFIVTWTQALDLLEREYEHLAGRHLVIEVDVAERMIRNDGMLAANARASSPAVRLAFDSKHGPLVYATDRFVSPGGWRYAWGRVNGERARVKRTPMEDWQHNVYAIAKALEALRLVDRYGVSHTGEQYTGYRALPAGTGAIATGLTYTEAREVIQAMFRDNPIPDNGWPAAIKAARIAAHPDRRDGDRTLWNRVDEAAKVLERHGG